MQDRLTQTSPQSRFQILLLQKIIPKFLLQSQTLIPGITVLRQELVQSLILESRICDPIPLGQVSTCDFDLLFLGLSLCPPVFQFPTVLRLESETVLEFPTPVPLEKGLEDPIRELRLLEMDRGELGCGRDLGSECSGEVWMMTVSGR